MGFDAKRIGGAGNTDVVVRWKDNEGRSITAIVDGKSKTSGMVSHTDISDVAIDTHKDKNNADFVAIIGPGFSGDTIRNHAKKKNFALITVAELVEIARSAHLLGLSLQEIASLFIVPDGLSQIEELISNRQRELEIISEVVTKICQEQELLGSLSPRDLFLLLRTTNVSPSLDELLIVFKVLSQPEIGLLASVNVASSEENTTYMLYNGKKVVNRLHALANAIEKGLSS
jgi:HPt (histidine-containing phosphotransfer) domain-containing protein